MVDELIYSELAKSFAAHGHFLLRGVPSHGYGFVYPVADRSGLAPVRVGARRPTTSPRRSTRWLMSLTAMPAYLLARRLVGRAGRAASPRC